MFRDVHHSIRLHGEMSAYSGKAEEAGFTKHYYHFQEVIYDNLFYKLIQAKNIA